MGKQTRAWDLGRGTGSEGSSAQCPGRAVQRSPEEEQEEMSSAWNKKGLTGPVEGHLTPGLPGWEAPQYASQGISPHSKARPEGKDERRTPEFQRLTFLIPSSPGSSLSLVGSWVGVDSQAP